MLAFTALGAAALDSCLRSWPLAGIKSSAKQSKAKQSKAKQSKAKQIKAKQSNAKQSKANPCKAKQSGFGGRQPPNPGGLGGGSPPRERNSVFCVAKGLVRL